MAKRKIVVPSISSLAGTRARALERQIEDAQGFIPLKIQRLKYLDIAGKFLFFCFSDDARPRGQYQYFIPGTVHEGINRKQPLDLVLYSQPG